MKLKNGNRTLDLSPRIESDLGALACKHTDLASIPDWELDTCAGYWAHYDDELSHLDRDHRERFRGLYKQALRTAIAGENEIPRVFYL